jgi:O-antigen ligase
MNFLLQFAATVVAAGLPIARWLPQPYANLWLLLAFAVIVATFLTLRVAAPWGAHMWALVSCGLIIAALASAPYAVLPNKHWTVAVQLVIWSGLAPFAVTGLIRSVPGLATCAIRAFVFVQTLSALAALEQARGGDVLGVAALYGRSSGLSGHANILGMFAGITLILLVHHLFSHSSALAVLALVVNAGALLTSGSISAMAAFAGGMAVYLIASRVGVAKVFGLLGIGILLIAVATRFAAISDHFKTPGERFLQVTGQTSEISTGKIRLETMDYAWRHIQARPFGGYGLDDRSGATVDQLTLTHNLLLRAWFQGGIAGFLAFFIVFVASMVLIIQALRRQQPAISGGVLTIMWTFALTAATFQQAYFWLPLLSAWAFLQPRPPSEKLPTHEVAKGVAGSSGPRSVAARL